jgi:hypothetical protein
MSAQIVIAVPYRKRPPRGYGDTLRALSLGAKIVSSQPVNSTAVKGPDHRVFHIPTNLPPSPARNLYYGNNIMRPLLDEAQKHGDYVVYLHDDVRPTTEQIATLIQTLDRMPDLIFASAAPRMMFMPDVGMVPSDWPDRCVIWRVSMMAEYLGPFTTEEGANGEATMRMVMNRILAAGHTETSWAWHYEMILEQDLPDPAPPPPPLPEFNAFGEIVPPPKGAARAMADETAIPWRKFEPAPL